ncbi:hypothetical protein C2I18_16520 [Paenibacillus sp. PK3_47]|uniref:phosphotransferase n=1 Tax=Paenibacillus sp. PK3_47 TaxID=2072642 RepID=UPI00201E5202|nr:phosphotransferase [Paenibacillus sp. PK3_47]UQZ34984.1 hypothetical protein C2I18_16520 [Paenibacillus sp. PK3_47]
MTDSCKLTGLLKDTVYCFVSPDAQVLSVESSPISAGSRAVELSRHRLKLGVSSGENEASTGASDSEISLITKLANYNERSALSRLYAQGAKVPFSLSNQPQCEGRSLLCIQDVDDQTDYSRLDIAALEAKEMQALAYIHSKNLGCREEVPWLPVVDEDQIAVAVGHWWKPAWKAAKSHPDFAGTFGAERLAEIESVAEGIVSAMVPVIEDTATYTMIHNDLNPGNVLVHNNEEVYFIDWEEACYGSLFLDIPMRCSSVRQAFAYKKYLNNYGLEIPDAKFAELFAVASRYLGLRYMCWNLGVWEHNERAKADLCKYMDMVTRPLFS